MFESIVSTVASIGVLIIASVVFATDADLANEMSSDPKAAVKDFMVNYTGLFVFIQFVNAFCVAALVEEMVKYFSYRMVVTPDLNPQGRSAQLSTNAAVEEAEHVDLNPQGQSAQLSTNAATEEAEHVDACWKNLTSTGSGITVAVSVRCLLRDGSINLSTASHFPHLDGVCGIGICML